MKRNWIVLGVVGVALSFMIWAGVRRNSISSPRALAGDFGSNVQGAVAPDFALTDIKSGRTVRLSEFKGKAVVLNFWATWCGPCKVEIPSFVDLQKQYGPQGLAVIGIAIDDAGREAVAKFADKMGVNYLVLEGDEKVANAYGGIQSLPTTFYLGRDGKVVKRVFGLATHGEIERNVQLALGHGTSEAAAAPHSGSH